MSVRNRDLQLQEFSGLCVPTFLPQPWPFRQESVRNLTWQRGLILMQSLKVILGITGMHTLCVSSGCGVCRNACSLPLVLEKSMGSAGAGRKKGNDYHGEKRCYHCCCNFFWWLEGTYLRLQGDPISSPLTFRRDTTLKPCASLVIEILIQYRSGTEMKKIWLCWNTLSFSISTKVNLQYFNIKPYLYYNYYFMDTLWRGDVLHLCK